MLLKTDPGDQIIAAPARILAFDRARTFITLLVLVHHSVVNYTYFGSGDHMRWLGFDLVVLFNDSFFMACMFFISGLFVRDSLARHGPTAFLRSRAFRLGIPFLLSIFVLMPIAYYPTFLRYHLPGTTDFNFFHFWWHTLTIGPWPSGPSWFLWVLLALDAIAAMVWAIAPRAIAALGRVIYSLRERPMTAFAAFMIFSIVIYVPMRLFFSDGAWLEPGGYPLPIQTSRILLYLGYFFFGVGVGALDLRSGLFAQKGEVAKRWPVWLGFAVLFYGGILILVYAHHNWVANFNAPPLDWRVGYGLAFALFSAAMTFLEPSLFLRFAPGNWRLMDALRPSAYGIFVVHYIFIIWLQYVIYDHAFPAAVKAAIVFAGTLSLSWTLVAALRRIPFVARMI
jgi:surface polysaccharide O-acyltransferase-like enzyme